MTKLTAKERTIKEGKICRRFGIPMDQRNWTPGILADALEIALEDLKNLRSSPLGEKSWEEIQEKERRLGEENQLIDVLREMIERLSKKMEVT